MSKPCRTDRKFCRIPIHNHRLGVLSKYDPLLRYLSALGGDEKRLRFCEIEYILGDRLPLSARKYSAWWANDSSKSRQSKAWLSAGFATADLDLPGEAVTFRKSKRDPRRARTRHGEVCRPNHGVDLESTPPLADEQPVRLSLEMAWYELGRLTCSEDGVLQIPDAPACAGLYRFRLIGDASARHYIGEAADLRRRFAHYRNPGPTQATNLRLNKLIRDHLGGGGQALLDIATGGIALSIGDAPLQADLYDKATRRLLEHAALVAEGAAAVESLNR